MDELARRLKLTKATRFVNVLEAGPTRVRNGPSREPFETGFELIIDVPIFDTGEPRVRKSEALYAQSVERFSTINSRRGAFVRRAYTSSQRVLMCLA